MPTDPNARRDQKLEAILGAVNKGNKLLEAQNKILEKMERNSRPTVITHHPYLDRSEDGPDRRQPGDQASDVGSAGGIQDAVPGGATDSAR